MHINFDGKVSALSANIIQNGIKLVVKARLDEVDSDTLDRLAEICAMPLGVHGRLQATDGIEAAELECWVEAVKGDFAKQSLAVTLSMHKSDLTSRSEALLVDWCKLEKDCSVEISGRQLSFSDIKLVDIKVKHFDDPGDGQE